jgi:biotin carboxylase
MVTILCVATYLKGEPFIRECHRLGARVLLLTEEALAQAAWPGEAIAELHTVPRTASDADVRRVVSTLARRHRIDRIAALDDFDVEMGAMLREFFQVPGFGRTVAARFRDKLTMRTTARRLGLAVPEFTSVANDAAVNDWADRVAPPWMLKPRGMAAATGIRVVAARDHAITCGRRSTRPATSGRCSCSSSSSPATSSTSIRSSGTAPSCSAWRRSMAGRRYRLPTTAACS